MSVLTRMLLVYLVIVVLIAVTGIGMFGYVSSSMKESLYANMTSTSIRMSQQLDNLVRPMEYTSLHLLSNHRFLSAAEDLAGIDRTYPNNLNLIRQAENEIYSMMMSYSFYKYFYRVSVFNPKKDFFSSNYQSPVPPGGYWSVIDGLDNLELLRENDGRIVVLPPFDDPWAADSPQRVFAVSRSIRGDPNMGFIEVQQLYSTVTDIFNLGDEQAGASVCAVTREGGILYDGGVSGALLAYYSALATDPDLGTGSGFAQRKNPLSGHDEMVTSVRSEYTGISILFVQDQRQLLAPLRRLGSQFLTLYIAFVSFSFLFFVFQSRNLVAPLRQLKRDMEATRLENLPENGSLVTSNNEITSLGHAFNDLKERLNELIQRELNLQTLHMQASFDALQAQINPHFIYNTLGLISNRAAMQGDEETSRICGAIASMLRYSVNTKTRLVTLDNELHHLEDYLYLMKERYEHRLEFVFAIDEDILTATLPKMVLQPLVENTINHGFRDMEGIMRIEIAGRRDGDEWLVEIVDNGQGFSESALASIREKCAKVDQDRSLLQASGGELGGLGIVNIYARLRLLSPGNITFSLSNNPEGGAKVILGGPMGGIGGKEDPICN